MRERVSLCAGNSIEVVVKLDVMTTNFSTATKLELQCIKEDALFLIELFLSLEKKISSSIFSPSIFPYFSLFVLESYQYFQSRLPHHALSLSSQFEPIIRTSRLRIKFFEDKNNQVQDVFELLEWVKDFHKEWHFGDHKGILAPLKRIIQDDFGIYLYAGNVIGTTHTSFMNFGVSKDDLPNSSDEISKALSPFAFSISKEMGEYAASVISLPEIKQGS